MAKGGNLNAALKGLLEVCPSLGEVYAGQPVQMSNVKKCASTAWHASLLPLIDGDG